MICPLMGSYGFVSINSRACTNTFKNIAAGSVRIMDSTLALMQSNPIHRRSAFALAFLVCHSRRESAFVLAIAVVFFVVIPKGNLLLLPTWVPHLQHSLTVFKVGYFVSIKLFICNLGEIPHCLRPRTLNLVRSSQAFMDTNRFVSRS